jgi:hypothetical protein
MQLALLIAVVAFLVYLLYVLVAGIFVTYTKGRVPIRFDLKNNYWTDDLNDWGREEKRMKQQLLALGFEDIGFLTSQTNGSPYVSLFSHPTEPAAANLNLMVHGARRVSYIQFATKFEDGSVVCTFNSRQPSIFKYPSDIDVHRSKALLPAVLFEEHIQAVEAHGLEPLPSPQRNDLESVIESNARVTEHQIEAGLLRPSDQPNLLKYTFFGAVKSTFNVWSRFQFLRPSRG